MKNPNTILKAHENICRSFRNLDLALAKWDKYPNKILKKLKTF